MLFVYFPKYYTHTGARAYTYIYTYNLDKINNIDNLKLGIVFIIN